MLEVIVVRSSSASDCSNVASYMILFYGIVSLGPALMPLVGYDVRVVISMN